MQSTKNYQLVKQELTDTPDITQISGNWDKIDTEIKKLSDDKFDKTGGTIKGTTTITGKVTANGGVAVSGGSTVTGGATTDTLTVTGDTQLNNAIVDGKLTVNIVRAKDGAESISIGINNPKSSSELLGIISQWVNGTTPRVSVTHHPPKDSNDKSVATTNWVKSLIATTENYGLVRLAKEPELLAPVNVEAAINPKMLYDIEDFRKTSTAYVVGDKVKCPFNFELFLECTTAGTTNSNPLDTRGVRHGQVLNDGTVNWTVRTHVRSIKGITADANGDVDVTTTVLKRW